MTEQEIFTKVATHLLAQMARSRSGDDGVCLYRGDNGLQCAAGCLIPDELYSEALEEKSVTRREVVDVLVAAGVVPQNEVDNLGYSEGSEGDVLQLDLEDPETPAPHLQLVRRLQHIHDCNDPWHWRIDLALLAAEKGLVMV